MRGSVPGIDAPALEQAGLRGLGAARLAGEEVDDGGDEGPPRRMHGQRRLRQLARQQRGQRGLQLAHQPRRGPLRRRRPASAPDPCARPAPRTGQRKTTKSLSETISWSPSLPRASGPPKNSSGSGVMGVTSCTNVRRLRTFLW